MTADSPLRRLGIVDRTSNAWAAGASYTKMLVHSLGAACREAGVELWVLSQQERYCPPANRAEIRVLGVSSQSLWGDFPGERTVRRLLRRRPRTRRFPGEGRLRRLLGLPEVGGSDPFYLAAQENAIQVLLPAGDVPAGFAGVKAVGWIPDFQHVYLPEFFVEEERRARDEAFHRTAARAARVMLSSQDALQQFQTFALEHAHKGRAVPFPSNFAFEPPDGDAGRSRERYHLPPKFALVANQFWGHKNHLVVVEAVRLLKESGVQVPLVLTGLPADYRDPENRTMSRLLQAIAAADLSGQVIVLGRVAFADLVDLMQTAALVIQPSRFEGWSTSVQDAKALGRPLICSDLPVHREQAPSALGFFPQDRADLLADLLAAHWEALRPGPDPAAEAQALQAEREFARRHGHVLLALCREALSG